MSCIWNVLLSSQKLTDRGFLLWETRNKCGLPGRNIDQQKAEGSRTGKRAETSQLRVERASHSTAYDEPSMNGSNQDDGASGPEDRGRNRMWNPLLCLFGYTAVSGQNTLSTSSPPCQLYFSSKHGPWEVFLTPQCWMCDPSLVLPSLGSWPHCAYMFLLSSESHHHLLQWCLLDKQKERGREECHSPL